MKQNEKTIFRRSKKWKDFRKQLKDKQKNDPITGSKLTLRSNCHHKDLDSERYDDLSDESHFVMLNQKTHDTIHFIYNIYRKDPEVLQRIKELLDQMVELNEPA